MVSVFFGLDHLLHRSTSTDIKNKVFSNHIIANIALHINYVTRTLYHDLNTWLQAWKIAMKSAKDFVRPHVEDVVGTMAKRLKKACSFDLKMLVLYVKKLHQERKVFLTLP